jgi:hypothetical protein
VVLVHVQITIACKLEIESPMPGEQLQHVVEEANARSDFVLAAALDHQLQ